MGFSTGSLYFEEMKSIVAETDHLYLKIITEIHFDNLYTLLSNPKVQEFFPKILNKQEVEQFYKKSRNGINLMVFAIGL